MLRLKELKNKEFNPKFEELFYFLYSIDLDYIMDFEKYEKDGKLNVDIGIYNMKQKIRITELGKDYTIIVDYVERNENGDCIYQKVEYFSYKTLSEIVIKLKELLSKFSDIIVIEYDKRPYKSIYKLLEYAKMEIIADDSSWFNKKGLSDLRITLMDPKINKNIFVEYSNYYSYDCYEIIYHDYDYDEKKQSINEYFIRERFKTEEELCEKLKELIAPCLRKRRVHKIGYKYNSIRKELFINER